jgi:hypothetical protein
VLLASSTEGFPFLRMLIQQLPISYKHVGACMSYAFPVSAMLIMLVLMNIVANKTMHSSHPPIALLWPHTALVVPGVGAVLQ